MHMRRIAITVVGMAAWVVAAPAQNSPPPAVRTGVPRTADGKPNLAGIWQVSDSAPAGDLRDHAARYDMRVANPSSLAARSPIKCRLP